jgi:hypothetical protein
VIPAGNYIYWKYLNPCRCLCGIKYEKGEDKKIVEGKTKK